MVKSIHIENFRCFQDFQLADLGQMNLIGGKNNAGKTSFLEALLLGNVPTSGTIYFLQQVRTENTNAYGDFPEMAWTNLFFGLDKTKRIKLTTTLTGTEITVEIECTEKTKQSVGKRFQIKSDELIQVVDSATLSEIGASTLKIKGSGKNIRFYNEITFTWGTRKPTENHGGPKFQPVLFTYFVPTGFKKPSFVLAREFDRAIALGKKEFVLAGLQAIDPQIKDAMTLNVGEPRIHIVRQNGSMQQLNFYGDALNKVVDIILRIVNNANCLLLIDEIENGIHHSNHEKFWSLLLKLTKEFRVQMFATSHSSEMIQAFQKVASENNAANEMCYFEMFQSERNNQIIANKINLETLAYQIQTEQPFRGE
ncbi:MAG: AAA family ATPase [Saprospiraceae bacterium]|nr:AAA family ATPase [Saprospiraceae bacterium]